MTINDRRLSPHFRLSEFLVSGAAARHGINMDPPPEVGGNLTRLCRDVLEPARTAIRAQRDARSVIIVSSGYRPPALNALIGGARNSAHCSGRAADWSVPGLTAEEVFGIIIARSPRFAPIKFDKAILEFGRWIHIQVAPIGAAPRGLVYRADRVAGLTVYTPHRAVA